MNNEMVFTKMLVEHYGVHNAQLHPMIQEDWRQLYRVDQANAPSWLLRAYAYSNSHHRQEQQVKVLTLLEKYGYPAPRLIWSQKGTAVIETVAEEKHWHSLVTTFIEGNVIQGDSPYTLHLLGEALGRFHAFDASIPANEIQALAVALWRPAEAVPFARQQLLEVFDATADLDHAAYYMIRHAMESIPSFAHLPEALNHGDCVPTNAVLTSEGQLVLIDWADAGRGAILLDLAWLLLMGMGGIPDEAAPITTIAPDPVRLGAIIDGYCQYRKLRESECTMLVDALRFVPAFYSALEFCATCRGERSETSWQAWWSRYQAAPIAAAMIMAGLAKQRE